MDVGVILSRNVRRLRQERQLSLGALAQAAGVAKQTLANLESAQGNPTVDTLQALGTALGLPVNWLVTAWDSPALVQRREEARWEDIALGRRRVLDRIHGAGQVDTSVLEIDGSDDDRAALPPGSLHHLYVLRGELLAGVLDDVHDLRAGDFIRFAADAPHVLRAPRGRAEVHLVTTIPQVQQFGSG